MESRTARLTQGPVGRHLIDMTVPMLMGITTMMAGEGLSLAPQNERTLSELNVSETWERFDEYFRLLEDSGVALNVVHNVGAAQVRRIVLGDEDVAPTQAQLDEMKREILDVIGKYCEIDHGEGMEFKLNREEGCISLVSSVPVRKVHGARA